MKLKIEPICPVDYGFQRLGGKYKGRLLLQLSSGTKRYGELRRFIIGITQKMLTQTLREMVEDSPQSRIFHNRKGHGCSQRDQKD